jgi:hypothetical protein
MQTQQKILAIGETFVMLSVPKTKGRCEDQAGSIHNTSNLSSTTQKSDHKKSGTK